MIVLVPFLFLCIIFVFLILPAFLARGKKMEPKKAVGLFTAGTAISFGAVLVLTVFVLTAAPVAAHAQSVTSNQSAAPVAEVKAPAQNSGSGMLAMAIAVGLGSIGAGIAVGMAAASAIGAISENPRMFTNSLIFVAMAEGIAIYGLVIAILIFARI